MRKAFVFDFDDTLAVTDATIRVFRDCQPWSERFVASLTPQEFSSYELKTGEHFAFSAFRDERFIKIKTYFEYALVGLILYFVFY